MLKKIMPLDGLRRSRDSGSAHRNMPQTGVLGQPGGGVKLFMALGATIDFEAGTLKRAPQFWRKAGMEWFYRFLKEPKRLFRRYFVDDIHFFRYFALQLLGCYRNPFAKG